MDGFGLRGLEAPSGRKLEEQMGLANWDIKGGY